MKNTNQKNEKKDQVSSRKDHEFSEELSDGGERNQYIKKQYGRNDQKI